MKRYILLVFCILCVFTISAQELSEIQRHLKQAQYEEAYSLLTKAQDKSPAILVLSGETALHLGKFSEAESHLTLAIKELDGHNDNNLLASAYNLLALTYWNQGQDQEAEKYMLSSIDLRSKQENVNAEIMAGSFNDLGLITARTNPGNALTNYEKALSIYRDTYGSTSEKVAQGLINTGIIFRNMQQYGDASNNFNQAGKIMRSLYPGGHATLAFIDVNLGMTYDAMDMKSAALVSYNNAEKQYLKLYGQRHPEIANVNNLMGLSHLKEGDYKEALTSFQKALIANSRDFDNMDFESYPAGEDYYHPYTRLNSLLYKARAYQSIHYNKSLKLKHLKNALEALELSDELIAGVRHSVNNEDDKLIFNTVAADIYEEAVQLSFRIAEKSFSKKEYFEKAFYFNERSKASVLQEAIDNSRAKNFAGIPSEVLANEKELQVRISFIKQKLREKPEENEEKRLRAELVNLELTYNELIARLEEEYPEYYNLKYPVYEHSISTIQEKIIPNTALISYFLSESNNKLYVFFLRKKNFQVTEKIIDDDFYRYIAGLRNGLYFQDPETFLLTSASLGKLLIPKIPSGIDRLVIIPSGPLNVIPFETLLIQKPNGNGYKDLSYLIKKYAVSYAYSAGLAFSSKPEEIKGNDDKPSLILAPVNFSYPGTSLPSLPATEEECLQIGKKLEDQNLKYNIYLGEKADENLLLKPKNNGFRVIHLATHGVIDENRPAFSRIYLSGGANDGRLYTSELYNVNLNSDLVTLSACETGLGKISKGEGVLGFTRALLYAGANNVIVSLWKVQDNSTAEFMVDFYDKALDKSAFAGSLRQAKLNMISSGEYSDPFYWAPFILIGE